jgi:hypothetical protein
MATVLDTIAEHLQKDPAARHLFLDDDEKSETPTIIETRTKQTTDANIETEQDSYDTDAPMQMF